MLNHYLCNQEKGKLFTHHLYRLVLTCGDNMDGARVEIFTTDGIKRGSTGWTAGAQETTVDVPQQLSPVIVTVTKPDGTRFVRLLK